MCHKDKMEKASKGEKYVEVSKPLVLTALDTLLRCALSYEDNIQSKGYVFHWSSSSSSSSSSSAFPCYISWVHHFLWAFCICDSFLSNHWGTGSHIPSSWMVHAECVCVAGIHPCKIWTSSSFESMGWNAYVHRLDLGLYSHRREFWGLESEPMLTPREKSPLWETFCAEEDQTHDSASSRARMHHKVVRHYFQSCQWLRK